MSLVINSIISLISYRRNSQIEFFKQNPIDVQKEMLFSLLKKASNTQFGREYDFASISTVNLFKERVPVHDYEAIKHYIERVMAGEKNLLWPGDVKWFAKSSGTTSSKSKFIPVTQEALEDCHFRGGKDVGVIFNNNYPETIPSQVNASHWAVATK
jgi:hypothetical protein